MKTTVVRLDWFNREAWIAYLANGDTVSERNYSLLRLPYEGMELTIRARADRPMMRAYEASDGITYFGSQGPRLPAFALNR